MKNLHIFIRIAIIALAVFVVAGLVTSVLGYNTAVNCEKTENYVFSCVGVLVNNNKTCIGIKALPSVVMDACQTIRVSCDFIKDEQTCRSRPDCLAHTNCPSTTEQERSNKCGTAFIGNNYPTCVASWFDRCEALKCPATNTNTNSNANGNINAGSCNPSVCAKYTYGTCPSGCSKRCTASFCGKDTNGISICTSDCEGAGGCYCATTNTNSNANINSATTYLACGCGCCSSPAPVRKCLYKAKGDSLTSIQEQDQQAKKSAQCATVGCSVGTMYQYCDSDKAACESQGGIWGTIGLSQTPSCNLPTTDGGKTCTKGTDCTAGLCIGADKDSIKGTCPSVRTVVGCLWEVNNGKATQMCID